MSDSPKKSPTEVSSFAQNYDVLQQAVLQLQDDEAMSVDDLLPLVDRATKAYSQCKQRLQLVEEALEKRFSTEESITNQS